MATDPHVVPWERIDTVLVDMDGTLLDLAFDNFFWQELVPSHYARLHGLTEEEARRRLMARYSAVEGSLAWYCIDHWTRDLGLDIRGLKWSHRHLISYLPQAAQFLAAVRRRGKRLLLVTNAHRAALAVKVAQTGLDAEVDAMISSHDYSAPKECADFWPKLVDDTGVDPDRTLLIEDSLSVLSAACRFGLEFVLAVRRPDTRHPARSITGFPAIDGVADIV